MNKLLLKAINWIGEELEARRTRSEMKRLMYKESFGRKIIQATTLYDRSRNQLFKIDGRYYKLRELGCK